MKFPTMLTKGSYTPLTYFGITTAEILFTKDGQYTSNAPKKTPYFRLYDPAKGEAAHRPVGSIKSSEDLIVFYSGDGQSAEITEDDKKTEAYQKAIAEANIVFFNIKTDLMKLGLDLDGQPLSNPSPAP